MKIHILVLFVLAAFVQACSTSTGTSVTNGVSNTNAPTDNSAAAKNEKSSTANAEKKTSPKTENSSETGSKSERVSFAAGKTQTFLKRTISANGSMDFVVNARNGQRMEFSATYDKNAEDLELFLTEPGLQDISASGAANEPIEFMIKKTGDHRITVNNKTANKVNIELGVVIK